MTSSVTQASFHIRNISSSQRESVRPAVMLIPALLLAAEAEGASISELILIYRHHGLGGERACRTLIHRLESLGCIGVTSGVRTDRREKTVQVTSIGRDHLRTIANRFSSLSVSNAIYKNSRDSVYSQFGRNGFRE